MDLVYEVGIECVEKIKMLHINVLYSIIFIFLNCFLFNFTVEIFAPWLFDAAETPLPVHNEMRVRVISVICRLMSMRSQHTPVQPFMVTYFVEMMHQVKCYFEEGCMVH